MVYIDGEELTEDVYGITACIDEPGIAEVFFGYFENLLETECVYSEEETIAKYEEIVEEAFREIEEIA